MRKVSLLILGAALGAGGATLVSQTSLLSSTSAVAASADTYRQLNLFGDVFEKIRTDYVEKPDEAKLIESAINGMLTSLDPAFELHGRQELPRHAGADARRIRRPRHRGDDGGRPRQGRHADRRHAGRRAPASWPTTSSPQIDGEQVQGLTLNQAVDKMRGPINSPVTLKIQRKEAKDPLEVKLTREMIKVRPVRARVEGDIGYLRITQFNEQTYEGLRSGIEKLNDAISAPTS